MNENTKVISFDIFDTLIIRPFLYPKDLFTFLNEEYRKMLLTLRDELKLLESGGSDYHGITVKPDIILGQGRNNIKIKELSLLNKINS